MDLRSEKREEQADRADERRRHGRGRREHRSCQGKDVHVD